MTSTSINWDIHLNNVLLLAIPVCFYYFGAYARHGVRKYRAKNFQGPPVFAPFPLQCCLGLPVCIVVVVPSILVLSTALQQGNTWTVLIMLAVTMEHGVIMNEATAEMIKGRIDRSRGNGKGSGTGGTSEENGK